MTTLSTQHLAKMIRNILSEESLIISALQTVVPNTEETDGSKGASAGSHATHLTVLRSLTNSTEEDAYLDLNDVPDELLVERASRMLEIMPDLVELDILGLEGAATDSELSFYTGALATWSWVWTRLDQLINSEKHSSGSSPA